MHIRPFGRLVAAAAFLLSMGPAAAASADSPSTDAQLNAARDLFLAAERDEDSQRWGDALEKLQRVSAVKLTSGIRYHMALCEEHLGHLLAALRDYKAAANQAHAEAAADVLRLVDKRVADTSERVPRLVVVLVPDLPDANVWLDGEEIHPGVPISVDPGTHNVEARAPGHAPSTRAVAVQERDATSIDVTLEPLAAQSTAPARASTGFPERLRGSAPGAAEPGAAPRDRTVAIVAAAGALGLAAAGIGAYAAAYAEHADAIGACAQVISPRTDACDARQNTVRMWDWLAVGAWVGAVSAGTLAVVSLMRLHRDASPSARLVGVVGPASVGLRGTF